MKSIIPSFTVFLSVWLLLCFTDHAHGSMVPLDASLITHDMLDLLRRQETTDSSSGDTDTAALTSPDGSTNTSPDSTSNAPSSSPPSPETTASTDTASPSEPPPTSSTPPTIQTSADPPAQSTSHQTTPATTSTTAAATTHTPDHTQNSPSQTHTQAQKTTPSTLQTPSTTPPPATSLDPTAMSSSSYAPMESAVTSINATLVLGDMECASDPLAQQNGRCPANHYCNAALKQCSMQLNNGVTCAADFQCTSGYCVGTCTNRPTSSNNAQALTGGQIAGITLGTIGGGLVALVGLLFCYRRRKRRMAAQQSRAMHFMLEGGSDDNDVGRAEMTDNNNNHRGKATTRLSKYNFLAQVLDGGQKQQQQQQPFGFDSSQQSLAHYHTSPDNTTVNNDSNSILDYQNEYYVSKGSLNHPPRLFNTRSVSSTSTTALRPRPITDDFNHDAVPLSFTSLPKPRPDSEAFSVEQRYPTQQGAPLSTVKMTNRDSMTDTALSALESPTLTHRYTEQQHQHFMDINTLWDDALHQSSTTPRQFHPTTAAPLSFPVSQDAWSHEDQASLPSTAPTTPRYAHHPGTVPSSVPPLPSGMPSSTPHPPFF